METLALGHAIGEMLKQQNIVYRGFQPDCINEIVKEINGLFEKQSELEGYIELVRERIETEYREVESAEIKNPAAEVFANSYKINFYSELHNFLGEDIEDNLTERNVQVL